MEVDQLGITVNNEIALTCWTDCKSLCLFGQESYKVEHPQSHHPGYNFVSGHASYRQAGPLLAHKCSPKSN